MLDANFRLKSKDRGVDDVELSPEWSYFVQQVKYWEEMSKHGDQTEVCCFIWVILSANPRD